MLAQEIKADQRTDDWYDARLGRATASRFKDVMTTIRSGEAAAVKNYRAELVAERLTGKPAESFTTQAMQHGIDSEPVARLEYQLFTGRNVTECGFFKHNELEAGASPDGLIGEDGLLEIKCPNTASHIETLIKRAVPSQYFWQVMGQLWITGRKWCDFVSFDDRLPDNAQLFITRVERDEAAIEQLSETVKSFLASVDQEVSFIKNYER